MLPVRMMIVLAVLALLGGCVTGPAGPSQTPDGASHATYERHKANRQAYMYQGI